MGDTHHDPTDHSRTTIQRTGIVVKDNFFWPGFILLGVALLATVSALLVAAYQHYEWLAATVLIAVLGIVAGGLWFVVELRHVMHIDRQAARLRR